MIFLISAASVELARAQNLPQGPRTFSTTFSLPQAGKTFHVAQGDDLQAVIDNASLGDTIILQAGATFSGNYRLPAKGLGTENSWIYIISSDLDQLPSGTRVHPANINHMPKIETPNANPAIATMYGAHNYRFAGIEITTNTETTVLCLLGSNGDYGTVATTVAQLPSYITFDRCYIHSSSDVNASRIGILGDGRYIAVIDSRLENFKDTGSVEGYAIQLFNGEGPYRFINNFMEGASQNFFCGGDPPTIPDAVPSDIEFRGNYLFKRTAWDTAAWMIKNLFELKNARRVLVDGNVFENCHKDNAGQKATGLVLTPRASSYNWSWEGIQDITITNNIIRSVGYGMRITGEDDIGKTVQTQRILIENNSFVGINEIYCAAPGAIRLSTKDNGVPILDLTIRHNLFLLSDTSSNGAFLTFNVGNTTTKVVENLTYENNISTRSIYGMIGSGVIQGTTTLNTYAQRWTWLKNIIISRSIDPGHASDLASFAAQYPPNNIIADENASVGFTDYLNGNYSLSTSSSYKRVGTDGKDPGPDWNVLRRAAVSAINGLPRPMAPTNVR